MADVEMQQNIPHLPMAGLRAQMDAADAGVAADVDAGGHPFEKTIVSHALRPLLEYLRVVVVAAAVAAVTAVVARDT